MSRNRKNFHYHYAEKFEDKKSRKGFSKVADTFSKLPKKTFIFTLIVLIIFGLVSTTFAAFVTSSDFQNQENNPTGSLVSNVKTMKVKKDIENGDSVASLGANADVAETGGQYWKGNIYFVAPEKWDISTYNKIQIDLTQGTSGSPYQYYAGTMTRVGSSRLFYKWIEVNHSSWNQEYICFTANSSEYGSGTFALSNNKYYTQPLNYGCNNDKYYMFSPSTETSFKTTTNNNPMSGDFNNDRSTLLKKEQTINLTTDGSSSNVGGSVKMTGYYDSGVSSITQSDITSTSSTVSYAGVQGSEMKLEATANSGYKFDGWYSGSTLLSTSATYTYNIYFAKTITAKFSVKKYSVKAYASSYGSLTYDGSTVSKNTYLAKDVDSVNGVSISVSPESQYTFNGWTVTGGASVTSASSSSTTVKATSTGTVTATYKAKPPAISSFTYANTRINTSVSPSVTTTGDNSIHKSFAVTNKPTGSSPTINSSTGAFSSATPGTYTITLTCYNAPTGATRSDDVTKTATVNVLPSEATFALNIQGNTRTDADGTESKPYEFNLRSDVSVSPQLTNPDASATYEWKTTYTGYGTYSGQSPTFTDIPTNAVTTGIPYTVTCKVTVNGVSTEKTFTIYFSIVNRYLNVKSFSMQKIFSPNSASIPLNVVLDASGTSFSTSISSSTSGGDGTYESLVNSYPFPTDTGVFDFRNWLTGSIKGVRYFNLDITDNSNPSLKANVNVRTAFGTESYHHTKTLYLVNSSSDSFDSYRVMAAYRIGIDGDDNWLTGQKMTTGKYRFTIPDNATHIGFYAMKPEKYQLVSTGTINSEFCHAFSEELYEISDSTFTISTIGSSEPCSFSGSFGPFTQQ